MSETLCTYVLLLYPSNQHSDWYLESDSYFGCCFKRKSKKKKKGENQGAGKEATSDIDALWWFYVVSTWVNWKSIFWNHLLWMVPGRVVKMRNSWDIVERAAEPSHVSDRSQVTGDRWRGAGWVQRVLTPLHSVSSSSLWWGFCWTAVTPDLLSDKEETSLHGQLPHLSFETCCGSWVWMSAQVSLPICARAEGGCFRTFLWSSSFPCLTLISTISSIIT